MPISKDKRRVAITVPKVEVDLIREAAASWNMSVSDYLASLARVDRETGLTAQAYHFAGYGSGAEVESNG